jgi:hypothetical protein
VIVGIEVRSPDLPNVCEVCRGGHGQRFSLAEALKDMPLPHRGCQCMGLGEHAGYCRCDYWTLLPSDFA